MDDLFGEKHNRKDSEQEKTSRGFIYMPIENSSDFYKLVFKHLISYVLK
jgi:hypothetical protein